MGARQGGPPDAGARRAFTMKVRTFGVLALVAVGIVPLVLAGGLALTRSERTALEEVRRGNLRVAVAIADRLRAHVDAEVAVLRTLGSALAPAVALSPGQAERVAKSFRLTFEHLRELDVVAPGCREIATSRADGVVRRRCGEPAVDAALAGQVHLGEVRLSEDFAPLMTMGVPLEVGGERVGAVFAVVDMVAIWDVVKGVRVGRTGTARLVTRDGTLIAHGDPEEARRVFLRERDRHAELVRRAGPEGATRYRDGQGREVLAVSADLPAVGWTVVVEEPVAEAYHQVRLLRRDLLLVLAGACLLAVLLAVAIGRHPVRVIERMRRHIDQVGKGDLDSRAAASTSIEELGSLASALDDMAVHLKVLHDELKARERLMTFGRVSAGLAHDLLYPIESVEVACRSVLGAPADPHATLLLEAAVDHHLPDLVRYVKDLRRLARGGDIPLELKTVVPRELAADVLERLVAQPRWRGVSFGIQGEAAPIAVDGGLLHRALTNLCKNAADACQAREPPREGAVTVEIAEDAGGGTSIAVRDDGVGMGPDRVRRVLANEFESTKHGTGIGLGLAVVRHIVEAHGGRLDVASLPGQGSVFRIELPRQVGDAAGSASSTPGARGHGP